MTTELWYLFATSALLSVLWIPYIVGQVRNFGPLMPEEYRELRDPANAPAWVRRANRAHLNLVEQFGAFAGLIVVAHLAGISTWITVFCAGAFFWLRILHAVFQISGIALGRARTVTFVFANLTLLGIAIEILRNALG